jgi:hypothetical protein
LSRASGGGTEFILKPALARRTRTSTGARTGWLGLRSRSSSHRTLTDRDAAELIRGIRGFRLLEGFHGYPAAGLLTATPGDRLSGTQVGEVLRLRRSFEIGDLAVIDWKAAVVVELDGDLGDVLFVLELANL